MKNLTTALLKAQKSMGVALKDAKNPFFKSKYADLNAVIDASIPALNEAGVIVLQPITLIDGKQYVETKLIHAETGESMSSLNEVVVKQINDAQQLGSGISYARRYGLQSFIVLKADDNDAESAVGRGTAVVAATLPKVKVESAVITPIEAAKITGTEVTPTKKFEIKRKAAVVEDDI